MRHSVFVDRFDLDITLRDVSTDLEVVPTRRAIAALSQGMPIEDAYYSIRELREAVALTHEGDPGGKRKLSRILSTACDDYQRAIYYSLAGRGIVNMLDALEWLEDLLELRGRIGGEAHASGIRTMPVAHPYVAEAPDGPLPADDAAFEMGPSWWQDPRLTEDAEG